MPGDNQCFWHNMSVGTRGITRDLRLWQTKINLRQQKQVTCHRIRIPFPLSSFMANQSLGKLACTRCHKAKNKFQNVVGTRPGWPMCDCGECRILKMRPLKKPNRQKHQHTKRAGTKLPAHKSTISCFLFVLAAASQGHSPNVTNKKKKRNSVLH